MDRKTSKNVVELAKDLGLGRAFAADLAADLRAKRLVHSLTALRAAKGLTQSEVAAKIGCTQGRISKIEASKDSDLSFRSIIEYARALDLRLEITLTGGEATGAVSVEIRGSEDDETDEAGHVEDRPRKRPSRARPHP